MVRFFRSGGDDLPGALSFHLRLRAPSRMITEILACTGTRGGVAGQDPVVAARRPSFRDARVPEPERLALGAGPLPATAWPGQPACAGPIAPRPAHKPFKAHAPGHRLVGVNYLPQMADKDRRRYFFVALDRATRWVFGRLCTARTAANARRSPAGDGQARPLCHRRLTQAPGTAPDCPVNGLGPRPGPGQSAASRLTMTVTSGFLPISSIMT